MKTLLLSLVLTFASVLCAQQTTKQIIIDDDDLKIYAYPNTAEIEDTYITLWIDRHLITPDDRTRQANSILEYIQSADPTYKIDIAQWKKLQHIKEKIIIDTQTNALKFIQSMYYASDGTALYNYKFSNTSEWSDYVPGTIFEPVYVYAKKLHKTKAPQ